MRLETALCKARPGAQLYRQVDPLRRYADNLRQLPHKLAIPDVLAEDWCVANPEPWIKIPQWAIVLGVSAAVVLIAWLTFSWLVAAGFGPFLFAVLYVWGNYIR